MDEPNSVEHQQSRAGVWMMVIAWVILLAMGTIYYQGVLFQKSNPNIDAAATVDGQYLRVTLIADRNGHFIVDGSINGQSARFLLDTGASDVAVPEKLRKAFQLEVQNQARARTANGVITVGNTVIHSLEIAGLQLSNVEASVNPGMNYSDMVLLGMSALSRLEINIQSGTMTLSQKLTL